MSFVGRDEGKERIDLSTVCWTNREKKRLLVEVTSSLPAAVTGKQTASWFALITGKWVRPEDDDRIIQNACDVIGDVVQCLISSPVSPRKRKWMEMKILFYIFTVGHGWYKWKWRTDYARPPPPPKKREKSSLTQLITTPLYVGGICNYCGCIKWNYSFICYIFALWIVPSVMRTYMEGKILDRIMYNVLLSDRIHIWVTLH